MPLLPVSEALQRILDGIEPPTVQTISIYNAEDRVLARDLEARFTQPPFDASAMDGYAVRGADLGDPGTRLTVVGASAAGHGFSQYVAPGQAARIFTGAPMPAGTDTVVIQEDVDREGDDIVLYDIPRPGANVRQAGVDFREGNIGLTAGRRLDAHTLTLAAAMGYAEVPVARKPVVAILATGDELVPPGTPPGTNSDRVVEPDRPRRAREKGGRRTSPARHRPRHQDSIGTHIASGARRRRAGDDRGASVGDQFVAPALHRPRHARLLEGGAGPGKPRRSAVLWKMRCPACPVDRCPVVCGRAFLAASYRCAARCT